MKNLLAIAALTLACSCAATRAASANLEAQVLDLKNSYTALSAAQAGGASEAELDVLEAQVSENVAQLKVAKDQLAEAVKEDAEGLAGLTRGGTEGGILGLGLTGLAWFMRDRRKKLGLDPLQRKDRATPPTNTGGVA